MTLAFIALFLAMFSAAAAGTLVATMGLARANRPYWFILFFLVGLLDVLTTLAGMHVTGLTFQQFEANPVARSAFPFTLLLRFGLWPAAIWKAPQHLSSANGWNLSLAMLITGTFTQLPAVLWNAAQLFVIFAWHIY